MRALIVIVVWIYPLLISATNDSPKVETAEWRRHAEHLFAQANAAYRNKDFRRAETLYRELVTSGVESADLYYNLGTVAAQLGKTGEAVLYLEKARRLAPRDADIVGNLTLVEPAANREEPFILILPFYRVMTWLSYDEWLWVAVVCYSASMLLWALRLVRTRGGPAWRAALATAAVITLASGSLAAWSYLENVHRRYFVVTAAEAPIYSGPDLSFTRLMTANEGRKLRCLPYYNPKWKRVVLPTGQVGFLAAELGQEL